MNSLIEKEWSKPGWDLKITAATKLDKYEWFQKKQLMEIQRRQSIRDYQSM